MFFFDKQNNKKEDRNLCVNDTEKTMVHIKNTIRNNDYCKVFWNKKNSSIYTSKSVSSNYSSLEFINNYHDDFRKKDRDIQVGDSVCYVFAIKHLPLLFCSITGIQEFNGKIYVYLEPNHAQAPTLPIWAEFDPSRFFFVSDNRCGKTNNVILNTQIYATCREELDLAEQLYAQTRVPDFLRSYIDDDAKPIGEAAFKACHMTLFEGIYDWAGSYRNEELVVQTDRRKTLHPDNINKEIKDYFNKLVKSQLKKTKDKETLIKTLIDVHKELAWIHPFQDGNGRAIRLFLELLALTRGYRFNLEEFIKTGKGKKSYYYAVRGSLYGNNKEIKKLFSRAIEELK